MIRSMFVLLVLASFPAIACESNTDCDPGSRCTRQSGQMSGVCVSALGNRTQGSNSSFDPLKAPTGKACSSDVECAYGGSCLKKDGQVYGVCSGEMTGGIHNASPR